MKMRKRFGIAIVTALLPSPFAAQGQRIPGGAERGAAEGGAAGGPVGGAFGGWLAASQEESAVCLASMKLPAFTM